MQDGSSVLNVSDARVDELVRAWIDLGRAVGVESAVKITNATSNRSEVINCLGLG
jgi:hypothetical protein